MLLGGRLPWGGRGGGQGCGGEARHGGGHLEISKFMMLKTFNMMITTTCSMEAGKPGRPMEEETLGAVK